MNKLINSIRWRHSNHSFLTLERIKAKAAAMIIKQIMAVQPLIKSMKEETPLLPLNNILLDKIQQDPELRPAFEEFQNIFLPQKGVVLPLYLSTQSRVKDGLSMKKYSFIVNRLVTPEVFRFIDEGSKSMLYGPRGISKSSSFILYAYLSRIINEYQFNNNDVIAPQIPRLFYLSYNPSLQSQSKEKNLKQYVNYLLFQQMNFCNKKKLEQLTLFQLRMQFLNKGLQLRTVLDQVNTLAAQFRKYNNSIDKKGEEKQIFKSKHKLTLQKEAWVNSLNTLTDQQVLFNSSMNLEDEILDVAKDGRYLSLNLNHHSKINKVFVRYQQNLSTQKGQQQILSVLFFELRKFFNTDQVMIESIDYLQKNFKLGSLKIDASHLQIRQVIKQWKIQMEYNIQTQRLTMNEKDLKQLIVRINQQRRRALRLRIQLFLNEDQKLKIHKFSLLLRLQIKIQNSNQESQPIKFKMAELKKPFHSQRLRRQIDKNLFALQGQFIVCLHNKQQMLEMIWYQKEQLYKSTKHLFYRGIKQMISQEDYRLIGIFFERYFLDILKLGVSFTIGQRQIKLVQGHKTFLVFNNQKEIQQKIQKNLLGKQRNVAQFRARFRDILNLPQNQYHLLLPVKNQKPSHYSVAFDVIIASRVGQLFEFISIDFTISDQKQLIKKSNPKILSEIKTEDLPISNWTHYVLVPNSKILDQLKGEGLNKKGKQEEKKFERVLAFDKLNLKINQQKNRWEFNEFMLLIQECQLQTQNKIEKKDKKK